MTAHKQTTDGEEYATEYTYNLSGALIEETYPSGRVVKNTLNADGNLASVHSKATSTDFYRPYANSLVYTAAGAVSSLRLGNGKFENTQFNSRLQPIQIGLGSSASSQDLLKLNYDYGTTDNNGNVLSQTITVPTVGASPGFTAIQDYTYDSLNRINDAVENIHPLAVRHRNRGNRLSHMTVMATGILTKSRLRLCRRTVLTVSLLLFANRTGRS